MPIKLTWIIVLSLFGIITAFSIYRDIQADKQNPPDLRNRVVGARLIKDGKSPYFYKWKEGDGIRYYDPNNFDTLQVSNTTATPFLHHLMAPLAALPERQISRCWLLIEYFMFLVIAVIAFSMAQSTGRKWAVIAAAGIFLLTAAWQLHIYNGQYYLCIPFLAMLFYYVVNQKQQLVWAFAAGTIAVSLVLIRANTILFFIPFFLLAKNYNRRYYFIFLLPALFAFTWFIFNKQEQFLWRDYRFNLTEQIKLHQGLHPALQKNAADPNYPFWEGIDQAAVLKETQAHKIVIHSENGNVFVIVNMFFHTKLSLSVLAFLSAIAFFALAGLFYFFQVRNNDNLPMASIAIMGFCLFMLSDLFSPVWRHQYYTIQWMFPVLIATGFFAPSFKWPYLLIWAGLILNCLDISFIKMEHSIGEYSFLLALASLVLSGKTKKVQ